MSGSDKPSGSIFPIIWIGAGAALALAAVIVTVIVLLLQSPSEAILLPTISATLPALVGQPAGTTPIPTFTSSPTASPSPTGTPVPSPTATATPSPEPSETPTMTPSITPTPAPVARAERDTRLYLGPGTGYAEQGWLPKGEEAPIISQLEGGEWWYVENSYGVRGWAQAASLTILYDIAGVPVVTPLPYSQTVSRPSSATATSSANLGPLALSEVWPTNIVQCSGAFEFDLWIKATGGTGVYTYLIDDAVIAENVVESGVTYRIKRGGAWVGIVSVISGGQRVDKEMYVAPADYCQ